jgi:imidazolonepropionase-like amidohydrolase
MSSYTIHTSNLFDPQKKQVVQDVSVTVDKVSGNIVKVFQRTSPLDEVPSGDVDLRGQFVMPGMVDAHTHIFLHSYDEAAALQQKRDESVVERIVRGVNHCRKALLAGYTTYRDLGSESLGSMDANMRDAIARGLMPGPRLFVATKVLASTGSYELRTENSCNGVCLPMGGEAVDGPEEARKAVRRRIAEGADVIKFFADYRRRIMRYPPAQQHPYVSSVLHPPEQPNPDIQVFDQEEMDAIVREAKLAKCPVACHAGTIDGAVCAARAGVDTIEHGYFANEELFTLMKEKGVIFVPTLAVCERLHSQRFPEILKQTKLAYDIGVRLACGGDTGTYPHGDNARELELMIEAGIPVEDVLESCTVGGWESCGRELCGLKFGWFEEGCRADIIALETSPLEDKDALRKVQFVMKDATIWKLDGKPVGMF